MIGSLIIQIQKKFRSMTPLDSETILWEAGPDGITAHVREQPAQPASKQSSVESSDSGGSFPCKIISKSGAFYNVTKYENGIDSESTGTAKVYILQLNFADTLPVGSWIVASLNQIGTTGGGNV